LRAALERLSPGSVIVTEYAAVAQHRWGWDRPPHARLDACLAAGRDDYGEQLSEFERHLPALRAIPRSTPDQASPQWENDYFAGLDAVALYSFLVDRRPARYVEIGSGYSTRFARRAITDAVARTTITSIDPAPRAEVEALCDDVHRVGLENALPGVFEGLEAGDVVLLDGSHVAHMGSDVVVAFTEIMPSLPAGVLLGIDDVFLPWDYPPTWTGRWYAEQYLLAVLLLSADPSWRTVFPAWWVANDTELAPVVDRFTDPARAPSGTVGMTFWMERAAPGMASAAR
jgi:hypothetical protein